MGAPREPKDFGARIMTALNKNDVEEANRLRGELFLAKLHRLTQGMPRLNDEQRRRAALLLDGS